MIGARVGERRQPHLSHPPQALHLRGFEQRRNDTFFSRFEGHQAVDRVAQDHRRGGV
jgi:hypothetical protein